MLALHLKRFGLVLIGLVLPLLVFEVGHRLVSGTLRVVGYRADRSVDAEGRIVDYAISFGEFQDRKNEQAVRFNIQMVIGS